MESDVTVNGPAPEGSASPKKHGRRRQVVRLACALALTYLVAAYLIMPALWDGYERRHPGLRDAPDLTHTTVGIPADPVNVALVGTKEALIRAMTTAKWYPAHPLTLKSSIEIAADTVLRRPYDEAPVSSLYLFKRKEDSAFEKPVGNDPRQRNHVRFWRSPTVDSNGVPLWLGSATYDRGVGLSHTTGEVTHHIAADVDAERDRLVADLVATGRVSEKFGVPDFHKAKQGRNGGGDPWKTDGTLWVCILQTDAAAM